MEKAPRAYPPPLINDTQWRLGPLQTGFSNISPNSRDRFLPPKSFSSLPSSFELTRETFNLFLKSSHEQQGKSIGDVTSQVEAFRKMLKFLQDIRILHGGQTPPDISSNQNITQGHGFMTWEDFDIIIKWMTKSPRLENFVDREGKWRLVVEDALRYNFPDNRVREIGTKIMKTMLKVISKEIEGQEIKTIRFADLKLMKLIIDKMGSCPDTHVLVPHLYADGSAWLKRFEEFKGNNDPQTLFLEALDRHTLSRDINALLETGQALPIEFKDERQYLVTVSRILAWHDEVSRFLETEIKHDIHKLNALTTLAEELKLNDPLKFPHFSLLSEYKNKVAKTRRKTSEILEQIDAGVQLTGKETSNGQEMVPETMNSICYNKELLNEKSKRFPLEMAENQLKEQLALNLEMGPNEAVQENRLANEVEGTRKWKKRFEDLRDKYLAPIENLQDILTIPMSELNLLIRVIENLVEEYAVLPFKIEKAEFHLLRWEWYLQVVKVFLQHGGNKHEEIKYLLETASHPKLQSLKLTETNHYCTLADLSKRYKSLCNQVKSMKEKEAEITEKQRSMQALEEGEIISNVIEDQNSMVSENSRQMMSLSTSNSLASPEELEKLIEFCKKNVFSLTSERKYLKMTLKKTKACQAMYQQLKRASRGLPEGFPNKEDYQLVYRYFTQLPLNIAPYLEWLSGQIRVPDELNQLYIIFNSEYLSGRRKVVSDYGSCDDCLTKYCYLNERDAITLLEKYKKGGVFMPMMVALNQDYQASCDVLKTVASELGPDNSCSVPLETLEKLKDLLKKEMIIDLGEQYYRLYFCIWKHQVQFIKLDYEFQTDKHIALDYVVLLHEEALSLGNNRHILDLLENNQGLFHFISELRENCEEFVIRTSDPSKPRDDILKTRILLAALIARKQKLSMKNETRVDPQPSLILEENSASTTPPPKQIPQNLFRANDGPQASHNSRQQQSLYDLTQKGVPVTPPPKDIPAQTIFLDASPQSYTPKSKNQELPALAKIISSPLTLSKISHLQSNDSGPNGKAKSTTPTNSKTPTESLQIRISKKLLDYASFQKDEKAAMVYAATLVQHVNNAKPDDMAKLEQRLFDILNEISGFEEMAGHIAPPNQGFIIIERLIKMDTVDRRKNAMETIKRSMDKKSKKLSKPTTPQSKVSNQIFNANVRAANSPVPEPLPEKKFKGNNYDVSNLSRKGSPIDPPPRPPPIVEEQRLSKSNSTPPPEIITNPNNPAGKAATQAPKTKHPSIKMEIESPATTQLPSNKVKKFVHNLYEGPLLNNGISSMKLLTCQKVKEIPNVFSKGKFQEFFLLPLEELKQTLSRKNVDKNIKTFVISGWICPSHESERKKLEEYCQELARNEEEVTRYDSLVSSGLLKKSSLYILLKTQITGNAFLRRNLRFQSKSLPDCPESDLAFVLVVDEVQTISDLEDVIVPRIKFNPVFEYTEDITAQENENEADEPEPKVNKLPPSYSPVMRHPMFRQQNAAAGASIVTNKNVSTLQTIGGSRGFPQNSSIPQYPRNHINAFQNQAGLRGDNQYSMPFPAPSNCIVALNQNYWGSTGQSHPTDGNQTNLIPVMVDPRTLNKQFLKPNNQAFQPPLP